MKSRVEREREVRKQAIMDAARKLFAEKGFNNVKMEDIAKASEFTRKTLYAYFKNKSDLYLQVFLQVSKERWSYLIEEMKKSEDGLKRIKAFGVANYQFTIANVEHFKMIVYLDHYGMDFGEVGEVVDNQLIQARKEIVQLLKESYIKGQNDGTIRKDLDISTNQTYLALTLRTMLNEVVLGYQNKKFYDDFLELFLESIKTH